jgi:hypothetical protein
MESAVLKVEKIRKRRKALAVCRLLRSHIFSTLKMEATRSSETSVLTRPTRRNIPENCILHSHGRENLISYMEY